MKRFRFRLEKVAVVREQERLRALERFAAAQAAAGEARRALEQATRDRTALETEWERRTGGGPLPAREWLALHRHHELLVQAEQLASQRLQERLTELRSRRVDLERARQREKALERLRSRQEAAYRKVMLAAEQVELDEIGQVTWSRSEGVAR